MHEAARGWKLHPGAARRTDRGQNRLLRPRLRQVHRLHFPLLHICVCPLDVGGRQYAAYPSVCRPEGQGHGFGAHSVCYWAVW